MASIGLTGTIGGIGSQGITIAKSKYYILGEYFEFERYVDHWTVSMISILNVLGKPYWEQLKMNNISFSKEIEDFIFLVKENTEVFSFCDEFEIISVNIVKKFNRDK